MANITDNVVYTWTDNDIYQIQLNDNQEGAGTGASFGGQGLSNRQGQGLADRTAFLNRHRVTDEANIAVLQAWKAMFASAMGANGWFGVSCTDSVLGQIQILVMWGVISLLGLPTDNGGTPGVGLSNAIYSFNWPKAGGFPNACVALYPYFMSNAIGLIPGLTGLAISGATSFVLEARTPLSAAGPNSIISDRSADQSGGAGQTVYFARTLTDGRGLTGIGYIAIGY